MKLLLADLLPINKGATRRWRNRLRKGVKSGFVRTKLFVRVNIDRLLCAAVTVALSISLSACGNQNNAVSGTIEVDEVHVGPRSGGRVGKIFAWEGDKLRDGQPIVQLEATELQARRDLAAAQIDTAMRDSDAQAAQLDFLRDDARRQQDLLNRQAEFTPRNVQTVEDRIRQVFGVKVRLPNNDDRLRAGMAADVYFPNVK